MFIESLNNTLAHSKVLLGRLSLSRRKPDPGETVTGSHSTDVFSFDSFYNPLSDFGGNSDWKNTSGDFSLSTDFHNNLLMTTHYASSTGTDKWHGSNPAGTYDDHYHSVAVQVNSRLFEGENGDVSASSDFHRQTTDSSLSEGRGFMSSLQVLKQEDVSHFFNESGKAQLFMADFWHQLTTTTSIYTGQIMGTSFSEKVVMMDDMTRSVVHSNDGAAVSDSNYFGHLTDIRVNLQLGNSSLYSDTETSFSKLTASGNDGIGDSFSLLNVDRGSSSLVQTNDGNGDTTFSLHTFATHDSFGDSHGATLVPPPMKG